MTNCPSYFYFNQIGTKQCYPNGCPSQFFVYQQLECVSTCPEGNLISVDGECVDPPESKMEAWLIGTIVVLALFLILLVVVLFLLVRRKKWAAKLRIRKGGKRSLKRDIAALRHQQEYSARTLRAVVRAEGLRPTDGGNPEAAVSEDARTTPPESGETRSPRVNGRDAAPRRGRVQHSAEFLAGIGAGNANSMEAARLRAELSRARQSPKASREEESSEKRKRKQVPLSPRGSLARRREQPGSSVAATYMNSEARGEEVLLRPGAYI